MTALRLAKEFSLRLVLVHATEAEQVAAELVDYETPVIVGPSSFGNTEEWEDIDWQGFARLEQSGVQVAICTDHPYMSVEQLRPAVIKAYQAGMSREAALKSVTLTAAQILGIEDELGSLAEDKDADLVILDTLDRVLKVISWRFGSKGKKLWIIWRQIGSEPLFAVLGNWQNQSFRLL